MPLLASGASRIGHGQLGLRSGLRSFDTLTRENACQKHAFVELRGSKQLTGWTLHSGSIYKATVDQVFDGRRLDVVQVKMYDDILTRVETLALVVAGTFFFDADATGATEVYARRTDSGSMTSPVIVNGVFGFYVGTVGVVQPTLGPDKLTDGALDVWTSPTALTNWATATSLATGATVNRDSTTVAEGTFSARLEGWIDPSGFLRLDNEAAAVATVAGKLYAYTGWYRTDPANAVGITARVGIGVPASPVHIMADGRSTASTSQRFALPNTYGEWQRFAVHVMAPTTTLAIRLYLSCDDTSVTGTVGGGFGKVWFDGLKMQRIYRWEYHEPRCGLEGFPSVEEGRQGIIFDRWFVGSGTLTLGNGDSWAEDLFGDYEWALAPVVARLGGRFSDGGNEVLVDNQKVQRWQASAVTVTDDAVRIDLDNERSIFTELLPARNLDVNDFADLAEVDKGRPRPLVFGTAAHTKPARVAKDGTTGYGTYEVLDPAYLTNNGYAFSSLDVYLTEEGAIKEDTNVKSASTPASVTVNTAAGTFDVEEDVKPRLVRKGVNHALDFKEGGVTLLAAVANGNYPATGIGITDLCDAVKAALDAAGGTYTVTYSNTTHKITVQQTAPATTFEILLSAATAPNRDRSLWPMLGFTADADKTGALTYTADDPIFTDVDVDHVVRSSHSGYLDDSSGTYTGTPGAAIVKPGDVMYFLLRKVFNVPVEDIDLGSVVTVRTGADDLQVFLGVLEGGAAGDTSHEFGQIIEWIENSNGIEMLHDGDRFVFRDRYAAATPVDLYDRDFLSFEGWVDDDFVNIVRLEGAQDPSTGQVRTATANNTQARLRLGRDRTKVFSTYLPEATLTAIGPGSWCFTLLGEAQTPHRRYRFAVKGACLTKIVGDQLRLNRVDILGGTPQTVRIIRKSDNWSSWVSEVEAVEVLA